MLIIAGGGDDDGSVAGTPTVARRDDADPSDAPADHDARDDLLDAVDDETDVDLDDAIASPPTEQRYDIVSGQLEPSRRSLRGSSSSVAPHATTGPSCAPLATR